MRSESGTLSPADQEVEQHIDNFLWGKKKACIFTLITVSESLMRYIFSRENLKRKSDADKNV